MQCTFPGGKREGHDIWEPRKHLKSGNTHLMHIFWDIFWKPDFGNHWSTSCFDHIGPNWNKHFCSGSKLAGGCESTETRHAFVNNLLLMHLGCQHWHDLSVASHYSNVEKKSVELFPPCFWRLGLTRRWCFTFVELTSLTLRLYIPLVYSARLIWFNFYSAVLFIEAAEALGNLLAYLFVPMSAC